MNLVEYFAALLICLTDIVFSMGMSAYLYSIFIIFQVIYAFSSLGHKGYIWMIKLSKIVTEEKNSILFCLLNAVLHISDLYPWLLYRNVSR
jgi:hypothetical protein